MRAKNGHLRLRLLLVSAVSFALALASYVDYRYHRNRIYAGVAIGSTDVGGLSLAGAEQVLSKRIEEERFANRPLFFRFGVDSWSFRAEELGIAVDTEKCLNDAFSAGRGRPHLFSYPARLKLILKPVSVPLQYKIDEETFFTAMSLPAQAVFTAPADARFILTDNGKSVSIVPDMPGRALDLQGTLLAVRDVLPDLPEAPPVIIAVTNVPASRSASYLSDLRVKAEVAFFSTAFTSSIPNRIHNIRLAAAALDGILVEPGDDFSFNEVVGETGTAQGYKTAPVILNRQLVEGVGGGICQVSSTLYNAVLLAGLTIRERANHSLAVGYLPPGMDATVSYGWRDFRFHNNKDHAVWIRTFISGNRLLVRLYGDPVPGQEIKIITTEIETIKQGTTVTETDELPEGVTEKIKDGQPGYKVTAWRVTYINGSEISRERLSRDTYSPVPAEIKIGRKTPSTSYGAQDGQETAGETANP